MRFRLYLNLLTDAVLGSTLHPVTAKGESWPESWPVTAAMSMEFSRTFDNLAISLLSIYPLE